MTIVIGVLLCAIFRKVNGYRYRSAILCYFWKVNGYRYRRAILSYFVKVNNNNLYSPQKQSTNKL